MQKRAYTHLKILSTKPVKNLYIYLIYMYKQNLALNNMQLQIIYDMYR